MTNIKISKKGKALLRRSYSSSEVVRAIVKSGDKLSSQNGLTVTVDGKTLKIKSATVTAEPATSH